MGSYDMPFLLGICMNYREKSIQWNILNVEHLLWIFENNNRLYYGLFLNPPPLHPPITGYQVDFGPIRDFSPLAYR